MLLEMRHITKRYGNLIANDDVSFCLNEGEILAIIGENGAGKSTIMKILYGLEQANEGEIYFEDNPVYFQSPVDAINMGIGMLHQHFMLFQSMTVAENIVYGREIYKNKVFFDKKKTMDVIDSLSKTYGMDVAPDTVVSELPVGVQQRVEILKILYQNAKIIIFDEPSAVLTPPEVKNLLETIKKLSEAGKSIILITHKLQEVMDVADRVVVMRKGKVVGERVKAETSIEELAYMMIGRQPVIRNIIPFKDRGDLVKVENLTLFSKTGKKLLDDISLHIQLGEIVGIAGVSGNGQSELVDCLFGLMRPDKGRIIIGNKDMTGKSVSEYRKQKVSLIPEDRYLTGSSKVSSLAENMLMGNDEKDEFCRHGIIDWKNVHMFADKILNQFQVAYTSSSQRIGELSGGNAQKAIVAREMTGDAEFFIADEPTRGIDIGAIEFIHNKILEKRSEGYGILLVSSELSEILELSDRIYVIYDGRITGEFWRGSIEESELGFRMLGGL